MSLSLACEAGTSESKDSGAQTEAPAPTATGTDGALLAEDFSHSPGPFAVTDTEGWSVGVRDGKLVLEIDQDRYSYVRAQSVASGVFSDVRLEVSATPSAGVASTGFGLICRYHAGDRGDSYYYAEVNSEREARIGRYLQGEQTLLVQDVSAPSLVEGTNRLRFECTGNRLRFFVEGQLTAEASDDALSSGQVGVTCCGSGSEVSRIEFDDFVAYAGN